MDLWGLTASDSQRNGRELYTDTIIDYLIPEDNGSRTGKDRLKTTGIVIHYTEGAYTGDDGEIWKALPQSEVGQHAGVGTQEIQEKLDGPANSRTVGIEMENTKLCMEYGLNPQTDVYRHYDISGKQSSKKFCRLSRSMEFF